MIAIINGTIINAERTYEADVLINGETIARIGSNLEYPENTYVIDAGGRYVMPGGVDVHTHFDLPMFNTVTSDDHYTGHRAAAFGGTTTVIDFVPLDGSSLLESVDAWHSKADS